MQRSAACVWREVTWYVVDCVRHNYNEGRDTSKPRAYLTCAEFHKQTKILVAGFDDGSFTVHEMPHFNLLQSFTWVSLSRINLLQSFTWVSLSHINLLEFFTSVNFSSLCWRNLPLTRFHSLRWLKLRHVFYFYFYEIFVNSMLAARRIGKHKFCVYSLPAPPQCGVRGDGNFFVFFCTNSVLIWMIVVVFYCYSGRNKSERHTSWLFINITVDGVPWQRSFCKILRESHLTLYHRFLTTSHVATK